MMKFKIIFLFVIGFFLVGWGATGHKIINRKTTLSFPSSMNSYLWWRDSLAFHASDADYRKSSDPTESPRHFIDIDIYNEFITTGRIPQTLDSLYALHGQPFVIDNGILPFAIIATTDSVRKYLQLHDWQKAMLKAADLGHYVADAHNPLHITMNYDGQLTNQTGVHSRYETQMINRDSMYFTYLGDSCNYISNINQYSFNMVYNNYKYVDSVLYADSVSRALAGSYGAAYYTNLWNMSGNFTIKLFKSGSNSLARLIYTAWINAGSPVPVISQSEIVSGFELNQNYPNPFNPSTKIQYVIPKKEFVNIKVFDISGKEIANLVNGVKEAGTYSVDFKPQSLTSGIYFYKMSAGDFVTTKRMMYIK